VIKRKKTKTIRFELEAAELEKLNTSQLESASLGISAFRKGASVFVDEDSFKLSKDDDVVFLNELIDDETMPKLAVKEIRNKFQFKTPLNVVFAHSTPERKFIEKLIANSDFIDAWIKSRDTGFYSIEYSWRKGEHPKQGNFNPDFFLKVGNKIIVIETKDDEMIDRIKEGGETAKEMKAKYSYTIEHFKRLNDLQEEQRYYFNFLTPKDFDNFFEVLKSGDFLGFKSNLDAELEDV
jgi:type III restriction enzyme